MPNSRLRHVPELQLAAHCLDAVPHRREDASPVGTWRHQGSDARSRSLLCVPSPLSPLSSSSLTTADLVLFSTLGIIVRWSIGVRLLTSAEAQDDSTIVLPTDENAYDSSDESPLLPDRRVRPKTSFAAETTVVPASPPTPPRGANGGGDRTTLVLLGADEELAAVEANGNGKQHKGRPRSIFQSFPNTPSRSHRTSVSNSEEEDEDEEGDEEWGVEHGVGRREEESEWLESLKRRTGKVWRPIRRTGRRIGEFMTVPLWAALLSLFVACVPPLQAGLNEVEPLKA